MVCISGSWSCVVERVDIDRASAVVIGGSGSGVSFTIISISILYYIRVLPFLADVEKNDNGNDDDGGDDNSDGGGDELGGGGFRFGRLGEGEGGDVGGEGGEGGGGGRWGWGGVRGEEWGLVGWGRSGKWDFRGGGLRGWGRGVLGEEGLVENATDVGGGGGG